MVFSTNTTAKKIVQRSRLRSISEPPDEPPAVPTPNAPDIPASFPECRRIRKIRITETKTCRTESADWSIARPGYYAKGPASPRGGALAAGGSATSDALGTLVGGRGWEIVERAQDHHRLAAQRAIDRPPVAL